MVYSHELKLLQKRKLSQLQICYPFSINRNMTWRKKKSLTFIRCNTNHFDTTCITCKPMGNFDENFKFTQRRPTPFISGRPQDILLDEIEGAVEST